jgi:hypothetical protein
MKKTVVCPGCGSSFAEGELVVIKPTLKEKPRWYEASHKNGEICCPKCNVRLDVDRRSLWPLLLLVPASAAYFVLPRAYGAWVFMGIGLASLFLLKFVIRYDTTDR